MDMLSRRSFASPYQVNGPSTPSVAEPPEYDKSLVSYNLVGDVVDFYKDFWGGVWNVMTGTKEKESPDIPAEEATKTNTSDSGMVYIIGFIALVGVVYYLKRR